MPRSGPNHSPHKRTRIVTSYFLGKTARRIGAEGGISDRAVYAIVGRYRDQESARDRPRSGRPSALTERDKRHIFILINTDPFIQHRDSIDQAGLNCSITTITRYLRTEHIEHWTALRRPKLTPEIARMRLEFARSYSEKPESSWKVWISTDEVSVVRGQGERQKWVFCRKVRLIHSLITPQLIEI
jgi:transposase